MARRQSKTLPPKKMLTFKWSGTDKFNEVVRGELEAETLADAKATLQAQQIKIKRLSKKSGLDSYKKNKGINAADIAFFTRQMATMMQSGVPLVQAFDICSEGMEKVKMKALVQEVRNDVAGGNLLSASLRKHPRYFDNLFCQLVAVGEQSGTLDTMLDRLALYKEKTEGLKAKVKKAMTYPIAVIIVAIVVTAILLIKVVPQFESLFKGFGADLPVFTQMVVGLSRFLQEWWWAFLLGIIAAVYFGMKAYRDNQGVRDKIQLASLKFPVVGGIVENAALARVARTLCTTYASGVPMVESIESAAGASGNIYYGRALIQVKRSISGGQTLRSSLQVTGVFPNMVIQMVGIGEEAGSLETMLDKVATFYESAVDNAIDSLTALLEPLIMAVLGVLVGGLIIAMYLPIFQLGNVVR